MSYLPDELWRRILEIGIIINGCLTYKDLCCLSISSRRLYRLSYENYLWNHLLSSDFSPPLLSFTSSSSSKFLYKFRFEKEKERILAAHTRVLLNKYSDVNEHHRRLGDIYKLVAEKSINSTQILSELYHLLRVRPVEQCAVPVDSSRIKVLEMKLWFCKQWRVFLENLQRDGMRKLDAATEELELLSTEYHAMHKRMQKRLCDRRENEHNVKWKKLKLESLQWF